MDNKKRMMFVLDEDYYFVTIKILSVLKGLDCCDKKLVDYRKLAVIIEFIKEEKNMMLLKKILNSGQLDLFESERLLSIYCKSNVENALVKRVLFFLEKKGLVSMEKNNKFNCVDVGLNYNGKLEEIFTSDFIVNDFKKMKVFWEIQRIKTLKYETFIGKIFGDSEVS